MRVQKYGKTHKKESVKIGNEGLEKREGYLSGYRWNWMGLERGRCGREMGFEEGETNCVSR